MVDNLFLKYLNMKYIVYCTTNLVNNKIYIGQHLTENPDKYDHYLGCGCYDNKPSSYNKPKTAFQYAVQKYGPSNFKRITIKAYDTLEEALALEAELVNREFLNRKDVYNEILGGNVGDSTTSIACYQYDLKGNFIASYDSQQKASYAVGRGFTTIKRAIKEKIKAANYFWSLTKVDKLDLSEYKTTDNKIPVFQYSETGEYDCCYESVSDAARVNNVATTNISRSCKLGYKTNNKYFSYEFSSTFSVARTKDVNNQKIYQYSLSGNFIREYDSYIIAQKEFKKQGLRQAIKLGRTWNNFQWKFEKFDKINSVETKAKARKVGQYDLEGNLIKVYDTVTKCKKEFSGCQHVLHGDRKTSGGFIFKYIE